ncbi:MAG: SDR family oxidoreductase [Thermoanaerobaculales bacterium]|nr:SDR family oxidoreductase [Thermoanaerobaculales bacterium]
MKPNEIILVTGGSRGIGRAVVERLLADGRTVAFTWRSSENEARQVEGRSGGLAHAFAFDLADRDGAARLVTQVEEKLGPIGGLVNNAGIEHSEIMAMMSDESWDRIIDTNLSGAFRLSREVIRSMVSRRRGTIVNVASLSALRGVSGHTAYAASKAGLLAMTRCLAREMGRRGIRVNAVVPGFVATDMTADIPENTASKLRSNQCLPVEITTANVAAAVAFLLSDEAEAITGHSLPVDAGVNA